MLELKNISHSENEKLLFENVSFSIFRAEIVGLVGPNGSGKTTLLELIAGHKNSYKGKILKQSDLNIFYLDIEAQSFQGQTVLESVCPEWNQAHVKLQSCLVELEKPSPSDALLGDYNGFYEEFERLGGYSVEHKIEKYLDILDLSNLSLNSPLLNLSGGEKMKLGLLPMLRQEFDLILLDEPTNNLDQKSIAWLIDFIKSREETFIVVSHDRSFLDAICSKTLVLDLVSKSITLYSGNYSFAMEQKYIEMEKLKLHYEVQQRLVKRLTEDIRTTKEQALKTEKATTNDYIRKRSKKVALKAKARECRLNKIVENKRVIKPKKAKKVRFDIKAIVNRSTLVAKAENLTVGYLNNDLVSKINLELGFGQRIVICGDNACGKTTLIKTLIGEIEPITGNLYFNESIQVGYLTQDRLFSKLNMKVIDVFRQLHNDESLNLSDNEIRMHLNEIKLFSSSVEKTLAELSLGERTKLELSSHLLNKPDLLVMDEPTNHLDIDAIEALEESLRSFRGTLVVISHDEQFVKRIDHDWTWRIVGKRLEIG